MIDYATQSMYEIEPTDSHEVYQYHNNSGQWEENEYNVNQEELKNIDKFNYIPIKKYDKHIRQLPVHRQRKVSLKRLIIITSEIYSFEIILFSYYQQSRQNL